MANYYDDKGSPGYNSGIAQIGRAIKREKENAAVVANPSGPPALVPAPTTGTRSRGVAMDPTPTQLAQEGALRPASGPWSLSHPQPMTDGAGELMRPLTSPPRPAGSVGSGRPDSIPSFAAITSGVTSTAPAPFRNAATPTIATVTPETAANADELRGQTRGLSAPTSPVRSDGGRLLGYGQMVNGVRVFSDGSGGPTAPPRTMSDANIANLAKEGRLSRADAGVGGGIGSEAFRGARNLMAGGNAGMGDAAARVLSSTPEFGGAQGYALTRSLSSPSRDSGFAPPSREKMAASDLLAFANKVPGSVAGDAGRAMSLAAQPSALTTRTTRQKAAEAWASMPRELIGDAQKARAEDAANQRQLTQEEGANQRTLVQEGGANQRAALARYATPPTQVNLADGTMGLLGHDGIVRAARDESGKSVRPEQTRKQVDQAAYSKMVGENINRLLNIDPLTGKKADGSAPSSEELYLATRAATAVTDEVFGGARGQSAGQDSAPTSKSQFLTAARASNPGATDAELEAYYDKTYGGVAR